jgi:hypothetical protein
MKKIDTEMGEYVVYHVSEAGDPGAHIIDNGTWFFQPSDVNDGEVFSGAYHTEDEATQAALDWVASQMDEAR